jgi:sugar O-acyltransferase (sialic acid O-acetyltransferase NeuD family)
MIESKHSAVIYGAGGHARELCFQLREQGIRVDAFVDDLNPNCIVRSVAVLSFEAALDRFPDSLWHVAIGDIAVRTRILSRVTEAKLTVGGFTSKNVLVAPSAKIAPTAQIFSGCVVSDGCYIGDHVIINFNCSVSHDVKIENETILSPRVTIAGNVSIGRRVFMGVGAVVMNGGPLEPIRVGDNAIIGAGACVIGDVASSTTVVGVPARKILRGEDL